MNSLNLKGLSAAERDKAINQAVAKIEGWEYTYGSASDEGFPWMNPDGEFELCLPPYATSCDAIMPLLEKWQWTKSYWGTIYVRDPQGNLFTNTLEEISLCLATRACIAYLRADGWTVET